MLPADAAGPGWDREFPGLMAWELRMLRSRASNVEVDVELLRRRGVLAVDFEWPTRNGGNVALRASFPPSYPYFRPHVFLRTDPALWPERHISPLDGGLCLLGRDSAQWQQEGYLVDLLETQLENALNGTGRQDPQAEPAEHWWNQLTLPGSYVLIDSAWDLSSASEGVLELRYVVAPPASRSVEDPPQFRGVVTQVRNETDAVIAAWDAPLPAFLATGLSVSTAWQRVPRTVLPLGDHHAVVRKLREAFPRTRGPGFAGWQGHLVRPFFLLHDIELRQGQRGDGWLVGLEFGPSKAFVRPKKGRAPMGTRVGVVAALRAGRSDLGVRVPAVSALADKCIAVVGCGALGAPVALELARNGALGLKLLDQDVVEPGNSIRWPLGASAWGKAKVDALSEFIRSQSPGCTVDPIAHALGSPGADGDENDEAVVERLLDGASIVVDASASASVNRLMWRRCQERQIPLIRLGATPSAKGGTVGYHAVGSACPVCVQHARIEGTIPQPAGHCDAVLMQPPGCAERTFVGSDYDLQELSLQAVRVAVAVAQAASTETVVYTLSLCDEDGDTIPPRWHTAKLPIHPECACHGPREASADEP